MKRSEEKRRKKWYVQAVHSTCMCFSSILTSTDKLDKEELCFTLYYCINVKIFWAECQEHIMIFSTLLIL